MTRTEFEAFLVRLLWRTGDAPLEGDLQYLMRMGESRLNRDLIVQQRLVNGTISFETYRAPLPADFDSLRALTYDAGSGPERYEYVTPADFNLRHTNTAQARIYTVTDMLEVMDNRMSASDPMVFGASYYATLPEYVDAETWVQRDFFDLYLHACLIYTAPYLKDDARLPQWQAMYSEMLESALYRDARRLYDGSPLKTRLPGVVA